MAKTRQVHGGQLLAARLSEKGFSRVEFCERLHISEAALSRWIAGKRRPSLEMAHRLEQELGIPAEDWLRKAS